MARASISGLVGWRQWLKERERGGAIGNYLKQRLLRPVHDWAMEVLDRIPQDGTFKQEAPPFVYRPMDIYSFDLKSATDRWPLVIIYTLMDFLFQHWLRLLLMGPWASTHFGLWLGDLPL